MVNSGGQALGGRGDGHLSADDGALVGVHADDLAAGLGSGLSSGGEDAAAAGKDGLNAHGLIPGVHGGGDVGITVELVAVGVLHAHLVGLVQLHSSSVSALQEAVAEAHDGGHAHAAQVAQVLIAQLHSSITGHVAAQLLLVNSGVDVGGNSPAALAAQVVLGHVQSHELHVGIGLGHLTDGLAEGETGHDDDVVVLVDGVLDHGHTVGGVVAGRLLVGELHVVLLAERLAGLVGGLVEGLVGDVAVVGDHGHGVVRSSDLALNRGAVLGGGGGVAVAAAGSQAQHHGAGQEQRKELLVHFILPSFHVNTPEDRDRM